VSIFFRSLHPMASISFDSLTNVSSLEPKTRTHLLNVYRTLGGILALAAAGTVVQMRLQISATLCMFGALGLLFWLYSMPHRPSDAAHQQQRLLLLGAFGFLKGATLGPLVGTVLYIQPELVAVAFGGTAAVFACFSLAALSAKRRSYLFLYGFLSSALSVLFWLSFANLFLRSPAVHLVQLYGGLLMFSGYVVYDTQLIVEKASRSPYPDYVQDALNLFVDFAALFVRILIILSRNSGKKDDRRKR
jgi:FtsH-binding integral membrane protein